MHASLFTSAIGLAILSSASARVLENRELESRDVCYADPAYKGMWNNLEIRRDVNNFCAGLLGLQAGTNCVYNATQWTTLRESITATNTIKTALTVASTKYETITNPVLQFGKRDAISVITDAPYLHAARDAIKRQVQPAGSIDLLDPIYSACSCGNAAGKLELYPTPEICTTTQTVFEQGFANKYEYTATVTSGITVVTVMVNETNIVTTSKATATSFAPVSLTSSAADEAPTFDDEGKWWRDHGWPRRSSSAKSSSTSSSSSSVSDSPDLTSTTTTTTTTTTAAESTTAESSTTDGSTTESSSSSTKPRPPHRTHTWGDWGDYNVTKSTSVQVEPTMMDTTTTTSASTSSTTEESSSTTTQLTTSDEVSPTMMNSTSEASTTSTSMSHKHRPPHSRTLTWGDWGDHNMTRPGTETHTSVSGSPTGVNTTSSSASVADITTETTTTSSFEVSPTMVNTTTSAVANVTTHSGWGDWNGTKTSYMVEPTLMNTTTTTTTSGYPNATTTSWFNTTTTGYPNATTTSFFNTTTTTGYQNTTSTPGYTNSSTSYQVDATMMSTTTTSASTTCPGASTIYVGNLTTTVYVTNSYTQPGSTITSFVTVTPSAVTVTHTTTTTQQAQWGGWNRWGRGGWGWGGRGGGGGGGRGGRW